MGKGNGFKMDLGVILRIVELVLLIAALTIFFITSNDWIELLVEIHHSDYMQASDAMNCSTSAFAILLLIILGLKIIKDEDEDQNFMGVLAVIGAILLIATGVCVCIIVKSGNNGLISGIMAIVAGAALIVEALKDFAVF